MNAIAPIVAVAELRLPDGAAAAAAERPVWTGRPAWRACAVRVWKTPWAALYFALLLADGLRLALDARTPQGWTGEGRLLLVAAGLLAGLVALGVLTARTTRYSIEARTVTLRYGMALPARLVIPFAAIAQVDARIHRDGTGDVALRLKPGQGVAYAKLWPHARPWRLRRAEPMLRCVPDAGLAAALICRALGVEATALTPPR